MRRMLALLAMSGAAHAVDISGHVAIENGGFIPPGSFVRAVLTIRNDVRMRRKQLVSELRTSRI